MNLPNPSMTQPVTTRPFIPVAEYHKALSFVYFLREDTNYRSEMIDEFLELLWAPNETKVIGIKIQISANQLAEIQKADNPIPLSEILAFGLDHSKQGCASFETRSLERFYRIANEVVQNETLVLPPQQGSTA